MNKFDLMNKVWTSNLTSTQKNLLCYLISKSDTEKWESWPTTARLAQVAGVGTVEAARAWASAGWPADHVLTSERLTDTWNPEFEERLTLTTPENRPRNP